MGTIKRKSIPSGTLKLKQLKNDSELINGQFKYVVEFPDGDRVGPLATKRQAKQRFDSIVENRSQSTNGGFMGGFF